MPSERILIVEDEPMWIELVRHWLAQAGYNNVQHAMTGGEALELVEVRVLDHIVIGDGECVAFSERGWL